MTDLLSDMRGEIEARRKELKPVVNEYARLQAAAAALDGVPANGTGAAKPAATRATKTAPTRRRSAAAGKRLGRPKGTGARAGQTLAIVIAQPGITIPQIAEKLGIKHHYLYRVLHGLAEDGLVKRDGGGWRPHKAA